MASRHICGFRGRPEYDYQTLTGNFGGFGRESGLHRNGPQTRISVHCAGEHTGCRAQVGRRQTQSSQRNSAKHLPAIRRCPECGVGHYILALNPVAYGSKLATFRRCNGYGSSTLYDSMTDGPPHHSLPCRTVEPHYSDEFIPLQTGSIDMVGVRNGQSHPFLRGPRNRVRKKGWNPMPWLIWKEGTERWGCEDCGFVLPKPQPGESVGEYIATIRYQFDLHKCRYFPASKFQLAASPS